MLRLRRDNCACRINSQNTPASRQVGHIEELQVDLTIHQCLLRRSQTLVGNDDLVITAQSRDSPTRSYSDDLRSAIASMVGIVTSGLAHGVTRAGQGLPRPMTNDDEIDGLPSHAFQHP
jgi:hypothetical protein